MLLMNTFCQFPSRLLLMWLVQYLLLSIWCDEIILTLEFVPVDVEAVSFFISAVLIQKASLELMGSLPGLLELLLVWQDLLLF